MKSTITNLLKRIKNLRKGNNRFTLGQPNMQYTPALMPVGITRNINAYANKTFFSLLIIKVFCTNPFMFL
ncbi:MAG: hypothetical protein SGJ10_04360 [Bacteroidota bacterium]|nr:hypothetical protein [Bacteroidota bacterium]